MAYDLGSLVPLTVQTRDALGNLADATTVVLTIGLPDGITQTTPTVIHPTVGTYQVDYAPIFVGRYTVRWVASGANSGGYTDVFDVSDPVAPYIISVADARSVLHVTTSAAEDSVIKTFVEAATTVIENHLRQVVVRRSITEDFRVNSPSWFYHQLYRGVVLTKAPAVSLVSVNSIDLLTNWPVNLLHLDVNTGIVTPLPQSQQLWGSLTISYIAGRSIIPANYQAAAEIIVQHLWMTRRHATPNRGDAMPDSLGRSGATRPGWGYAIPNAALELLGYGMPLMA